MFLLLLLMYMYFGCYGNFKFPLTCNLAFIAISLQIVWRKKKTEMLIERSSTKHFFFLSKPHNFVGNRNTKFSKNILKNQFLRSYGGDNAQTFQNCS